MDNQATLEELKQKIKNFCEDRNWDQFHGPKDLSIGIITEASELLEHFRFKDEKQIEELFTDMKKREEIEDELADTLLFILRFAQMNNIDISTAVETKMKKTELKYPLDKSFGSNKKYDEL